jgi:hypothetical protein
MATAKNVSIVGASSWFKAYNADITADITAIADSFTVTEPPEMVSLTAPNGRRYKGAMVLPYGDGGDGNDVITVQGIDRVGPGSETGYPGLTYTGTAGWTVVAITAVTCVLDISGIPGVDGAVIEDEFFFHDDCSTTITNTSWGNMIENMTGTTIVGSALNDNFGGFVIPDFGPHEAFRLETNITASTTGFNALVKLIS